MAYEIKPGSARHNQLGTIDCEIRAPHLKLPDGEWVPFTADPDDVEEAGRDVHKRLLAGEAGPIAPAEG